MKTCIDCQKEIGPYAERCRSCAATFRNLNGGGNFKDGHTLNQDLLIVVILLVNKRFNV